MKDQEQSGHGSSLQISETMQQRVESVYCLCFFMSTTGERWWLFNCNKKDLRKAIQWVVSGGGQAGETVVSPSLDVVYWEVRHAPVGSGCFCFGMRRWKR